MERLYIDGEYVAATSITPSTSRTPPREEIFAQVPDASAADIDRAIAAARRAQRRLEPDRRITRCEILRGCAERLEAHADELAVALTLEGGKTLNENCDEIEWTATASATSPRQLARRTARSSARRRRASSTSSSTGRSAWWRRATLQLPGAAALLADSAALATGERIVVKPPSRLRWRRCGSARCSRTLPAGVFNVVTARCRGLGPPGRAPGHRHDRVHRIGRNRRERSSQPPPRASRGSCLELGGNDRSSCFDDAQLDVAARGAVFAAYLNAGQVCTSAERFFVDELVYDDFMARAIELTARRAIGTP